MNLGHWVIFGFVLLSSAQTFAQGGDASDAYQFCQANCWNAAKPSESCSTSCGPAPGSVLQYETYQCQSEDPVQAAILIGEISINPNDSTLLINLKSKRGDSIVTHGFVRAAKHFSEFTGELLNYTFPDPTAKDWQWDAHYTLSVKNSSFLLNYTFTENCSDRGFDPCEVVSEYRLRCR